MRKIVLWVGLIIVLVLLILGARAYAGGSVYTPPPGVVFIVDEPSIDARIEDMWQMQYKLISCNAFVQRITGDLGNGMSHPQSGAWTNEVRFILVFEKQ